MYPFLLDAMEELGERRRYAIRYALALYTEEVEERNMAMIRRLGREVLQRPGQAGTTEEDVWKERRRWFAKKFSHWDDEAQNLPLTTAEYPHARWPEELMQRWGLRGITKDNLDLDQRNGYFAAVRNEIAGLSLAGECCPQSLPPDLVYLSCLVDAVHGPGLPEWRRGQQIDMISSTQDFFRRPDRAREYMAVSPSGADMDPDERWNSNREAQDLDFVWEGWMKSVGFMIGKNDRFSNAGSCAVFCRRLRDVEHWDYGVEYDPEEATPEEQAWKENDLQWQWRFGVYDGEWHSDLFDTVEEYLAWYADCKEPAAEKWW